MNAVLGKYTNGNTTVTIFDDGTKIREWADNETARSEFPECIDVNISYRCNGRCQFCYQNSTIDGPMADLTTFDSWLDMIPPYVEFAMNCNDPEMPHLDEFLEKLAKRNIIANLTVNQMHFMKHFDRFADWSSGGLVHGIGVSVHTITERTIDLLGKLDNVVVHTINGILSPHTMYALADHNLKLLILGYKDIGLGRKFKSMRPVEVEQNMRWLYLNIDRMCSRFDVISFDNLAVKQLNCRRFVKDWDKFYMGDDGTHSMYVDLVHKTYSRSSLMSEDMRIPFDASTNIRDMFANIRID